MEMDGWKTEHILYKILIILVLHYWFVGFNGYNCYIGVEHYETKGCILFLLYILDLPDMFHMTFESKHTPEEQQACMQPN